VRTDNRWLVLEAEIRTPELLMAEGLSLAIVSEFVGALAALGVIDVRQGADLSDDVASPWSVARQTRNSREGGRPSEGPLAGFVVSHRLWDAGVWTDSLPLAIPPELAYVLRGTKVVGDDSDVSRHRARKEGAGPALAVRLRPVRSLFSQENDTTRVLRAACGFLTRALSCWRPGEAIFFATLALESQLLEGGRDSSVARLQEAVASCLGGARAERDRNRRLVARLYEVRSQFVHRGRWEGELVWKEEAGRASGSLREVALELAEAAMRRELLELPSQEPDPVVQGSPS
jgi:hypothetical protein